MEIAEAWSSCKAPLHLVGPARLVLSGMLTQEKWVSMLRVSSDVANHLILMQAIEAISALWKKACSESTMPTAMPCPSLHQAVTASVGAIQKLLQAPPCGSPAIDSKAEDSFSAAVKACNNLAHR